MMNKKKNIRVGSSRMNIKTIGMMVFNDKSVSPFVSAELPARYNVQGISNAAEFGDTMEHMGIVDIRHTHLKFEKTISFFELTKSRSS